MTRRLHNPETGLGLNDQASHPKFGIRYPGTGLGLNDRASHPMTRRFIPDNQRPA